MIDTMDYQTGFTSERPSVAEKGPGSLTDIEKTQMVNEQITTQPEIKVLFSQPSDGSGLLT